MNREIKDKMTVLGVMSGTSLDGIDLALCTFEMKDDSYHFTIDNAITIPYSKSWKETLSNAQDLGAEKYFRLHHNYGSYIAVEINKFLEGKEKPFAVGSHGHTIFHQPHLGFTTQIGCGATIAAHTGLTTVCDFRSLDVANGGQGAPLVPVGDKLLFAGYDSCLNIGGIANISFGQNEEYKAHDICFANMALNYLAEKLGKPYDENGDLASSGKADEKLLEDLSHALNLSAKASLAREQFEKLLVPVLHVSKISVEDKLATLCVYAGNEIAQTLTENNLKSVLVTGGGAYNKYLIDCIKQSFKGNIIIPNDEIIQFKEALIFAFLGYLRLHEKTNTLKSVTGAKSDSVGGAVYFV
ncbi:MAG: anhydro-N-acetylmuramic acid kinase [Bacteroidia bacterium]